MALTNGAAVGRTGDTFPSIRRATHLSLQERLHLWKTRCNEIAWRCSRSRMLWGKPCQYTLLMVFELESHSKRPGFSTAKMVEMYRVVWIIKGLMMFQPHPIWWMCNLVGKVPLHPTDIGHLISMTELSLSNNKSMPQFSTLDIVWMTLRLLLYH